MEFTRQEQRIINGAKKGQLPRNRRLLFAFMIVACLMIGVTKYFRYRIEIRKDKLVRTLSQKYQSGILAVARVGNVNSTEVAQSCVEINKECVDTILKWRSYYTRTLLMLAFFFPLIILVIFWQFQRYERIIVKLLVQMDKSLHETNKTA